MPDHKHNVLKSKVELFNWKENRLKEIKQEMEAELKGIKEPVPMQKKRNASQVFEYNNEEADKVVQQKRVNLTNNNSQVFSNVKDKTVPKLEPKGKKHHVLHNNSIEMKSATIVGSKKGKSGSLNFNSLGSSTLRHFPVNTSSKNNPLNLNLVKGKQK